MPNCEIFKNRKLKINAGHKIYTNFPKIGIILSFFRIIFSFLNDPGKGGPEDIMSFSMSKTWLLLSRTWLRYFEFEFKFLIN